MTINIPAQADLPAAARDFINAIGDRRIFAFDAPMGAGKTTFISEVCRRLGVSDDISSPTFAIVNEYLADPSAADPGVSSAASALPRRICHFDCYRIEDPAEAEDMGIDDYLYSGDLCLIEWPDRVEDFLPDDTVTVNISVNPDDSRTLSF